MTNENSYASFSEEQSLLLMKERMFSLFRRIVDEKENLVLCQVPVYNARAQFVGGKTINFLTYCAVNLFPENERAEALKEIAPVIDLCAGLPMETWGILNSLTGIRRLTDAGVLEKAVSKDTESLLRKKLDWRTFVDESAGYALIHKPTNYYGVAFGIAALRAKLGWEDEKYAAILLKHLEDHIDEYSGDLDFMDETKGEGRFDRYSILIPAEIEELCRTCGYPVPEKIHRMLKKSAEIVLSFANDQGYGFSYGRSIGAYGEAAALQILAAALADNALPDPDSAFAYTRKLAARMIHFWYDPEMASVNMWKKGRRTDSYRNINRILGENLSLTMQLVDVLAIWKSHGYKAGGSRNCMMPEQGSRLFRFLDAPQQRALYIYRSGRHVFSLPLISGGTPYYDKDPYLPVPRENAVLEAVPDVSHMALVPVLTLQDGRQAAPICHFDKIEETKDGVRVHMNALTVIGRTSPVPEPGITCVTDFSFSLAGISRRDCFEIMDATLSVTDISLQFDTFSCAASVKDCGVVFESGPAASIFASGFGAPEVFSAASLVSGTADGEGGDLSFAEASSYRLPSDSYDTPHGACKSAVFWKQAVTAGQRQIRSGWTVSFERNSNNV